MPKVSVIVPVYNVEKYIDRCIQSLINQTLKDIEIIVVNDGSTDNSKKVIEKYIFNSKKNIRKNIFNSKKNIKKYIFNNKKNIRKHIFNSKKNIKKYIFNNKKSIRKYAFSSQKNIEKFIFNNKKTIKKFNYKRKRVIKNDILKIRYFEKENGGLSSARNFGIEKATGDYIGFLDSDDYVQNDIFEKMYYKAIKDDSDMVECDFIWEWSNKRKYDKRKYSKREEMLKKPRVVAWNKLIKRRIIMQNNIRFPEGLIYEDLEFFYKLIPYINKVSYVPEYLIHYVQREDSISNVQTIKNADIFVVLDNIFEFYKNKKIYIKELNYMKKRILLGSSMKRILKIKDRKLRNQLIKKTIKYLRKGTKLCKEKNIKLKKCKKAPKKVSLCRKKIKKNKLYQKILIKDKLKKEVLEKNKSNKEISKTVKQNNGELNLEQNGQNKLKIVFGITKLGIGGAERVLVDLANVLIQNFDITIFTIYSGGELEKELNPNIKLINLYKKQNKFISLYILLFGKHIYSKYLKNKFDVDIAFLEGPITRIFSYGKNEKIAWVHNDINKVFGETFKAKIKCYLDKKFYKKYNKIVFVSKQNKQAFENKYGNIGEMVIIKNYIDKNRIINKSKEKIDCEIKKNRNNNCKDLKVEKINDKIQKIKSINYEEPIFITVARLVKQKGIDRFIRVHKRLIDDGLKHKVYIIGDGEERKSLQKLVKTLNVQKTFIFLGKKENPYPYIKLADYFVLLSYYEGYGMVLEEAKVLNKPIIITKTAAIEAVEDYEKKLIIENDEEEIYKELKKKLKFKK